MTKLKQQLIRLGKQFPQLRDDIRPVLRRIDGRSPQPQPQPQKPPMGYGGGYGGGRQRYASRNKQARRNLFKELVDHEEIVSLMRETDDRGVKNALRSIMQEFYEILTLDDNEEMALNRLENLISRGPNDQNDLRNQVMKIANHLGLDLEGLQFFASKTSRIGDKVKRYYELKKNNPGTDVAYDYWKENLKGDVSIQELEEQEKDHERGKGLGKQRRERRRHQDHDKYTPAGYDPYSR